MIPGQGRARFLHAPASASPTSCRTRIVVSHRSLFCFRCRASAESSHTRSVDVLRDRAPSATGLRVAKQRQPPPSSSRFFIGRLSLSSLVPSSRPPGVHTIHDVLRIAGEQDSERVAAAGVSRNASMTDRSAMRLVVVRGLGDPVSQRVDFARFRMKPFDQAPAPPDSSVTSVAKARLVGIRSRRDRRFWLWRESTDDLEAVHLIE